jgi:hypothetical protein
VAYPCLLHALPELPTGELANRSLYESVASPKHFHRHVKTPTTHRQLSNRYYTLDQRHNFVDNHLQNQSSTSVQKSALCTHLPTRALAQEGPTLVQGLLNQIQLFEGQTLLALMQQFLPTQFHRGNR